MRESSDGSTSALRSSAPPAMKRTIDSATSSETRSAAGLHHGGQRLRAGHPGEPHPVLRDRGHDALHALEMREVILAQRDEDPIVAAGEVESLDDGLVVLHPRFERLRRAVLDEIGEILEELRRALAAEVVVLRQRENFLELVEDQQRDERPAGLIAENVVAVVQELPERFAFDRHADLRPLAGALRRAKDGLLDLLGRRRRLGRIVEAHVDRAVALGPQPRHDPGTQDRGLAKPGLPEEDREQLALHAARELGHLLFAAVEIAARLLGERVESEPRMLRIDSGLRDAVETRRCVVVHPVYVSAPGRDRSHATKRDASALMGGEQKTAPGCGGQSPG